MAIATIAFAEITRDARVLRQARSLGAHHDVSVIGYGGLPRGFEARVRMLPVPEPGGFVVRNMGAVPCLIAGRVLPRAGYGAWYWGRADHRRAVTHLRSVRPEVVIANDWDALPVADRARREWGARVIVDLHEYSPLHWQNRRAWMALIAPMIDYVLRNQLPHVSAAFTVNETLAEKYRETYAIRPGVIRNIPDVKLKPAGHATDGERIRLIHHGLSTRDRYLQDMIEAVALAKPRFELHFMLVETDAGYVRELRQLAERRAPGRVFFHPAVAPHEIVQTIAQYDMGFFALRPVTFNYQAALPNKLFDFIAAGLAVAVSPNPEMARLVSDHGVGTSAPDYTPASMARMLDALTVADIDRMKAASTRVREELSSDKELEVLRETVEHLLPR